MNKHRKLHHLLRRTFALLLALFMIFTGNGVQTLAQTIISGGSLSVAEEEAKETNPIEVSNETDELQEEPEGEPEVVLDDPEDDAEASEKDVPDGKGSEEESESAGEGENESAAEEGQNTQEDDENIPVSVGEELTPSGDTTEAVHDYIIYINGEDATTQQDVTYGDDLIITMESESGADYVLIEYGYAPIGGDPEQADWKKIEADELCLLPAGQYWINCGVIDNLEDTYYDYSGKWSINVKKLDLISATNVHWDGTRLLWTKSASVEDYVGSYKIQLYKDGSVFGEQVSVAVVPGTTDYEYDFNDSLTTKGIYTVELVTAAKQSDCCNDSAKAASDAPYAKVEVTIAKEEGISTVAPLSVTLTSGGAAQDISATVAVAEGYKFSGWICDTAGAVVFTDDQYTAITKISLKEGYGAEEGEDSSLTLTAYGAALPQPSGYVAVFDGEDHNITAGITGSKGAYEEVTYTWYKGTSTEAVATGAKLTVKNVKDSGSYRVVAKLSSESGDYIELEQTGITVTITKAVLAVKLNDVTAEYGETLAPDKAVYYWGDTAKVCTDTKGITGDLGYDTDYVAEDVPGTYQIWAVTDDLEADNYTFKTHATKSVLTMTKRALTADDFTVVANDKTYNGATDATVKSVTVDGFTKTENIGQFLTKATFDTAEVGTNKTVTVKISLDKTAGKTWVDTRYSIPANLSVTCTAAVKPIDITVTADEGQSKDFGTDDPLFYTYKITSGALYSGDELAGELSREEGEEAGKYAITRGTMTDAANPHYNITFVSKDFTIHQSDANVVVITNSGSKTYDGNVLSNPTVSKNDDYTGTVSFKYYTKDGEEYSLFEGVPKNAGTYYVKAFAAADKNYKAKETAYAEVVISPKPITVTADEGQRRYFNQDDPETYTYTVEEGGLCGADTLSGKLTREAGTTVGKYDILIGTLTNPNYKINFVSNKFEIDKAIYTATVSFASNNWIYDSENRTPVLAGRPTDAADPVYHYATYNGTAYTGDSTVQPVDAGKYQVWAVIQANHRYVEVTTAKYEFEIKKRPITITSGSGEWNYDGAEHSVQTFTVKYTGDETKDPFAETEGIQLIAIPTKAKDYESPAKENAFEVKDIAFRSNTKEANYDITLSFGTLTIKKITLLTPASCTWNPGAPGMAAWVQLTCPVYNKTMSYELVLMKDGTPVGDPIITTNANYDFSTLIRQDGLTTGVAGKYTFKVRAVMPGDGSVIPGEYITVSDSVASIKTTIQKEKGVTVKRGNEKTALGDTAFFLSGETVTLTAEVASGHYFSGTIWKDDSTSSLFEFADTAKASTTMTVTTIADSTSGKIKINSGHDDPDISFSGITAADMSYVKFTMKGTDQYSDMVRYALTTSSSKPTESQWITVPEASKHKLELEQTILSTDLNSHTTYYFHIEDEYGQHVRSNGLNVYVVKFQKGGDDPSKIEGTMNNAIKVQGTNPNLPMMGFTYPGWAFQNWLDDNELSYPNGGQYVNNADMVLTAQWSQIQYTYKVNYMFENLDGDFVPGGDASLTDLPSDVPASKNFTATYQTVINYNSPAIRYDIPGLEPVKVEGEPDKVTITTQGQEFTVYYGRITYTIEYWLLQSGKTDVQYGDTEEYKFGHAVTVKTKPSTEVGEDYEGYTFVGWTFPDNGKTPETMPAKNIKVTGNIVPKETSFTVYYFTEDPDHVGEYILQEDATTVVTTLTGSQIFANNFATREFEGRKVTGLLATENDPGPTKNVDYIERDDWDLPENAIYASGKSAKKTCINLYYDKERYRITLNVRRTNAAIDESPVYSYSWYGPTATASHGAGIEFGATVDTEFYETYNYDHWLDDYPKGYKITETIAWSTGPAPTTMPGKNIVVTRYIMPTDGSEKFTVEYYLQKWDGTYPEDSEQLVLFADAIGDTGVAAHTVAMGSGTDPDTKYVDPESDYFKSQILYSEFYELDPNHAGSVLSISRDIGEHFDDHLVVYLQAKERDYTVKYYYNLETEDDHADHLFKTETFTERWGTVLDSDRVVKYFDGSATGTEGSEDFDYRNNNYMITYSFSAYFNKDYAGSGTREISTDAALTQLENNQVRDIKVGQYSSTPTNGHNTMYVYYRKVNPPTSYQEIPVNWTLASLSKATDAEKAHKRLTVTVGSKTYNISIADKAYAYETTYTPKTNNVHYPALNIKRGNYNVSNTLRDGFSTVTYGGKTWVVNESKGTLYSFISTDLPLLFLGNQIVSVGYPNSTTATTPGVQTVLNAFEQYKIDHATTSGDPDKNLKFAYLHGSSSWGTTYFTAAQAASAEVYLYFTYASTSTYYHIANGERCSGHTYRCYTKVPGSEIYTCSDTTKTWERGAYRVKWYYDSNFNLPVTMTNETPDSHHKEFFIYGNYVYAVQTGMDHASYKISADGIGYITDPEDERIDRSETVSSVTVYAKDGGDDYVERTVVTKKYYVTDSFGVEHLALTTRSHPAVSFSDTYIDWTAKATPSDSGADINYRRSDFDITGYVFDTGEEDNITAGVPNDSPLNLYVYYAPITRQLTADATNPDGTLYQDISFHANKSRVTIKNPTKYGYVFTGWTYYHADGETALSDDEITALKQEKKATGEYVITMPNFDLVAKANWAAGKFTTNIVYHWMGADRKYATDTQTIYNVEIVTESDFAVASKRLAESSIRTYYSFDKCTVTDPTKKENNVTELAADGSYTKILPGATIDYYYQRTPDTMTLTLNQDGYLDTTEQKATLTGAGKYYFGQEIIARVNYNEAGYTFDGWYLVVDGVPSEDPVSTDVYYTFTSGGEGTTPGSEWWPRYETPSTSGLSLQGIDLRDGDPVPSVELLAKFTFKQPDPVYVQYAGKDTYTYAYTDSADNQITAKAFFDPDNNTTIVSGYQWYKSTDGTTWEKLDGETSTAYHFPTGMNAGTYYYRCNPTVKVKANGYEVEKTANINYTVTVNPTDMSAIKESYTGVYDGESHSPGIGMWYQRGSYLYSVPAGSRKIYYRTTTSGEYSETLPSFTAAGTYTVYFWADSTSGNFNDYKSADAPDSVTVTITQAPITVVATGKQLDKVYDHTTAANLGSSKLTEFISIVGVGEADKDKVGITATSMSYDNKDVELASYVTISGLTLTGELAGDYVLAANSIVVNGKISPLTLETQWAKDASTPPSDTIEYSFDGNFHHPIVVFPTDYTDSVASVLGEEMNAGTYIANATIESISYKGAYDAKSNYVLKDPDKEFTILRDGVMVVSAPGYDGIYDGMAHAPVVTVTKPSRNTDVTIYYSTTGAITKADLEDPEKCSVNAPTYTDVYMKSGAVASQTVWYYVKDNTGNYIDKSGSTTVKISPATVTVKSGITANDKDYDGNKSATLGFANVKYDGVVPGESVDIMTDKVSGLFTDAKAGKDKTVNLTYNTTTAAGRYILETEGVQNFNYILAATGNQPTAIATIKYSKFKAKIDDVTGLTYNGNLQSYTTVPHYEDLVEGTVVSLQYSADGESWTDDVTKVKTAGTHVIYFKASAEDYDDVIGTFKVTVNKKELTGSWSTTDPYTYDKTEKSVTPSLNGIVTGDVVRPVTSGTLKATNAGSYTASIDDIQGPDEVEEGEPGYAEYLAHKDDVNNYKLKEEVEKKWKINPKAVNDGFVADPANQVYCASQYKPEPEVKDGDTTLAEGTDFEYDSYGANTDVGSDNWVKVTFKGNYTGSVTKYFDITQKELTISWSNTDPYTYNSAEKSVTASLVGVETSDVGKVTPVKKTGTTFAATDVGTYSAEVSGLSGDRSANYKIKTDATISKTWKINKKNLTVSWKDMSGNTISGTKHYTYTSTEQYITPVLVGVETADAGKVDVTVTGNKATNANTGTTAEVTALKEGTSGDRTGNYQLSGTLTTTWAIDKKNMHITGIKIEDKLYDGTTAASWATDNDPQLKAADICENDKTADKLALVSTGKACVFDSASVGKQNVSISGFSLTGSSASNYSLVQDKSSATIISQEVTITGLKVKNKVYDGTTVAEFDTSGVEISVLTADKDKVQLDVSSATATFAGKDVNTGITVTFGGTFKLKGDRAANYKIADDGIASSTTADITKRTVSVTWPKTLNFEYNGSNHTLTPTIGNLVTAEKNDIKLQVKNNVQVNAGIYNDTKTGFPAAEVYGLELATGAAATSLVSNYQLPGSGLKAGWTIGATQLGTPTVTWDTTLGQVKWGKVADVVGDIQTVPVASYTVSLFKKSGTSTLKVAGQTASVPRNGDQENYTYNYYDYIKANPGVYIVKVKAVASVDAPNVDNCNVVDGKDGVTAAPLRSANVTFKYGTGEDTTAARQGITSAVKIGSTDGTDSASMILVDGETAVAVSAVIKNKTGYTGVVEANYPACATIGTCSITTESEKVKIGTSVKIANITDDAATNGIVLSLNMTAKPAAVQGEILAKLNGVSWTVNKLEYGYTSAQCPTLYLSVHDTELPDEVSYVITNYNWYHKVGNSVTDLAVTTPEYTIPTGKVVNNSYRWKCSFTATRTDNGKSVFVEYKNTAAVNWRLISVIRANREGIDVTLDSSTTGKTWTYGDTGTHYTGTTTVQEDPEIDYYYIAYASAQYDSDNKLTNAPVYDAEDKLSDAKGWTAMDNVNDLPKNAGTYAFCAYAHRTQNYNGLNTFNKCVLTIEKAKLATPTNIKATVGAGETPLVTASWDTVPAPGTVKVTYNVRIIKGEVRTTVAEADILGSFTGLKTTSQDIFSKVKDYYGKYYIEVTAISNEPDNCYDSDAGTEQMPHTAKIVLTGDHTSDTWTYDGKYTTLSVVDPQTGYTYQWYYKGVAIDGAISSTYKVKDVAKSGYYCCEVTDSGKTVISNFIKLSISKCDVEIKGLGADNKVYNAKTDVTITGKTTAYISPNYDGDELTITEGTASFGDKNVADNKDVTFTGWGITGEEVGNYNLKAQPATVKANITKLDTTITGLTASNKVYDTTTTATPTGTAVVAAKIAGDTVTVSAGTAAFSDKNVGTGKTVTFSGYSLSGTDAGNYNLTAQPASVTANITARPITIKGLSAKNKTYDATAAATEQGTAVLDGNLDGSNLTLVHGTCSFSDKNAANGKTVTFTGYSLSGSEVGNYSLTAQPANVTANITKLDTIITGLGASDKTYDATTAATVTGTAVVSALITGDVVTVSAGSAAFDNKNVGTGKTVTFSGYSLTGTDAGNYNLTAQPASVTAKITKLDTIITGLTAKNKVYDKTTTATPDGTAVVSAKIAGDTVTVSAGTATFSDKNVADGKTVTFSGYSLSGTDAGNYNLTAQPASVTANITARPITIKGLSAKNKVYDGNNTATEQGTAVLDGNLDGANLTLVHGTCSFDNENVGTGKTVTFTGYSLSGSEVGNYALSAQPANVTANITKKEATLTGIGADDKVYDATTVATPNGTPALSGTVAGDDLTIVPGTAAFDNKNVGTNKTVTFSGYSLGGTDAGNYEFKQPASVKAKITKLDTTITGLTAKNKVYDKTTAATPDGTAVVSALIAGDIVTVTAGTAAFSDKNVADGKTVTFSGYSLSGTDAGNYNLTAQPASVTANITAKPITIKGLSAKNKTYDATTAATEQGTAVLDGNLDGANLTLVHGTCSFSDKNAANGKTVTFTGYSLSGSEAGNYSLTAQPANVTANITKLDTIITGLGASDKTYDATTAATVTGTAVVKALITGDVVTVSAGSAAFDNKNVGTGKTVTFSGYSLTGTDAGNYNLTAQPASVTAKITKLDTIITGLTAKNKVYDKTTTATPDGTAVVASLIAGDTVTVSAGTAAFSDKNVADGKTVSFSGYSLSGTDAGNYNLTAQPASVTANITARPITIKGLSAKNKVYDGDNTATEQGTAVLDGNLDGIKLTLVHGTCSFSDKNVGTGKTVTFTGYSLSGSEAGNYSLTAQPANVTADITKKALKINGVTAEDKIYDATATATPVNDNAELEGVVTGDDVTLNVTGSAAAFANKNAGSNKNVTFSGYTIEGTDVGNYSLSQPADVKADIFVREVLIKDLKAKNKVYDGTKTATHDTTSAYIENKIGTDNLGFAAGTANFSDKNAGIGKVVSFSGYTLTGTDAANYKLVSQPASTTADISPRPVTITGLGAKDKVYDGTLDAETKGTPTIDNKITGDVLTIEYGTAQFTKVGPKKHIPVEFTGFSISGSDAANYTLTAQPATTTANITPRYLVEHYLQKLDLSGYTLDTTETADWTVGQQTTAEALDYQGYTAQPFEQVFVEENTNITVKIYYDRNYYTVSFDMNGSTSPAPEDQTVIYGGKVTDPGKVQRAGYMFKCWTYEGYSWNFKANVVVGDMTLKAKWDVEDDPTPGPVGPIYDRPTPGATPVKGHWILVDPKARLWKYQFDNGTYATGGWVYVDNEYSVKGHPYAWFCFGDDSYMKWGWLKVENPETWYYTNVISDGDLGMMFEGWHDDPQDGFRYYLEPVTGKMYTGWHTIDGKEYYFDEVGIANFEAWYLDMIDPKTGFQAWKYRKLDKKPLGSMYRNEMTPDGHLVDANGVKIK